MNNPTRARRSLADRYFSFITRRRTSDVVIFHGVLIAVLISAVWFIVALNNHYTTTVPSRGGTLVEGVVGTPRFVNPVLAISRADHDMVSLIYSGLVKLDENGKIVPDIAENITVSEDGRTYHITLRQDVTFHNGTPLTAKDVAYTVALIQNPDLKSPLQGNWNNVLVEELGDYELNIVLEEPYTPFIENLRVGILPRDLWDELPIEQLPFSQNNTEPIGSGPYKIVDVLRTKSGLINGYRLEAFENYGIDPNLDSLVFNFYQNDTELKNALKNGLISSAVLMSNMESSGADIANYEMIEQPLPRTFAVYFNQNKSAVLRDEAVREALDVAIDREALIEAVLPAYGIPTYSPIPPQFADLGTTTNPADVGPDIDRLTRARSILTAGSWSQNEDGVWTKAVSKDVTLELRVNIATANSALFDTTTQYVATVWRELGVEVTVSQYEQADLVQAIIRPRNYEALLFGADIGRGVDLFPFWHSSQKDDPGLNIAQYTNIDADALLQRIRLATNETDRDTSIRAFLDILAADTPAVFLFSPTFHYVFDPDLAVTPLNRVNSQSDRFANISTWHLTSNKIWPIFQNN